jgi:hypothetical protein
MFGTVWPAEKFKFDAVGRVEPVGHTVRYESDEAPVEVTFNATASTPVAGTPPRPRTVRFNVCPAPIGPIPENCPSVVG